ncbi:uncharacterized protein LOC126285037 [Schistocerca gregaria]|uniref:uncharacterized protein LOC126285037 n=1 Tax=Schistocerca gregaria TaxID=7010 RepID=UPI00211ECCD9|nr:uncharacterized protein LOC126285037 [Schistocerca gregaria]
MELRVRRLRRGRRQRCKDGRLSLLKAALQRSFDEAKERRQMERPGCEKVEEDEEVEEDEVVEDGDALEERKEAEEGANLKEGEEHEEGGGESCGKAQANHNCRKPATVVSTSPPTSEAQCSPPVAENDEDLDELAMLSEDQHVYELKEITDHKDVCECNMTEDQHVCVWNTMNGDQDGCKWVLTSEKQGMCEWNMVTDDKDMYECKVMNEEMREWDPMVSTLLQATTAEEQDHTPTSPTEGMSLNEMDTWSGFDDVLIDL